MSTESQNNIDYYALLYGAEMPSVVYMQVIGNENEQFEIACSVEPEHHQPKVNQDRKDSMDNLMIDLTDLAWIDSDDDISEASMSQPSTPGAVDEV